MGLFRDLWWYFRREKLKYGIGIVFLFASTLMSHPLSLFDCRGGGRVATHRVRLDSGVSSLYAGITHSGFESPGQCKSAACRSGEGVSRWFSCRSLFFMTCCEHGAMPYRPGCGD